ncbi:MAG: ATP-binding protein [Pseudomonadota bacterium]
MKGKRISLERRLVSYVGVGWLLFSVIAGAVSYRLAYQNQFAAEQAFQQQLLRTVQAQAEVAVFARNTKIAEDLFEGLLTNPTVLGARIASNEGYVEEQGKRPQLDFSKAASYPLYSPVDGKQKIGAIFLLQDDAQIASLAARTAFSLTAWLLLQIVIGTVLLFAVSRAVMGRPIAALAAAVSAIRPGSGQRVPVKEMHSDDEIGLLSHQTNALIEAAEAAMAESERAKQVAEGSNQAKGDFLALMSHEIRTPLSAVIGILDLALRDETLLARTREQIEHGTINARSLLKIINDLLDFSKIEGGKLSLEAIDFALVQCIEEAADVFQHGAARKTLRLQVDIAAEVPAFAHGDPTRLRQVLINLIGNALKFTEEGEVVVTASMRELGRGRREMEVAIRDTGVGIAAEALPRLFNKFEQSDTSMARRFGGTGLGLAICRQLVELMGGRIWVASTLGEGTTFRFTMPVLEGSRPTPPVLEERLQHSHCLHILVAEDFVTNQIIIRSLLEDMGHVVQVVDNGFQAIEAVAENDYDLVLMDGRMPEMDGITATRIIRAGGPSEYAAREPGLPIVALTANVGEADHRRYMAAGMNEVMTKPVDELALHRLLERIITARLTLGVQLIPQAVYSERELDLQFDVQASPASGLPPTLTELARQAFVGEIPARQAELLAAMGEQDADRAGRLLHSLRGGAAQLGMDALRDTCAELEAYADAKRWERLEAALPRLDALLKMTREPIRTDS